MKKLSATPWFISGRTDHRQIYYGTQPTLLPDSHAELDAWYGELQTRAETVRYWLEVCEQQLVFRAAADRGESLFRVRFFGPLDDPPRRDYYSDRVRGPFYVMATDIEDALAPFEFLIRGGTAMIAEPC